MQSLESLGYRYKFWSVAADHLLIGTNHPEITKFLGHHVIEPEPFHVTYTRMPSTDLPERGLVHDRAYWLSDIELRDSNGPLAKGVIDVVSLGFGKSDPTSQLTVSAGTTGSSLLPAVPLPYVETERTWSEPGIVPVENKLEIVATNISSVTVDTEAARVDCDVDLVIESDGPVDVTLLGCPNEEAESAAQAEAPPPPETPSRRLPATGATVPAGIAAVFIAAWIVVSHMRRRCM